MSIKVMASLRHRKHIKTKTWFSKRIGRENGDLLKPALNKMISYTKNL